MRQLQPVLWTKGVLLTPQHLQTQDRFLEDLLQFRLAALTFCPWGFRRLDVFLAVPEYRPGATNVAGGRRDADARYRAEELLRRDENTGLAELPIQVARKNARLLVGGEALDGLTSLRVAR